MTLLAREGANMDVHLDDVRTALYYPHTGIRTIDLLKTSLLLWDHVEYITPPGYHPPLRPRDVIFENRNVVQEAMEFILVRHEPTEEEQDRTHSVVERLLKSDIATWLQEETIQEPYLILPGKLAERTYRLLQEFNLAEMRIDDPRGDYSTAPVVGLVLMSMLADACAGTRRRRITDQHAGYKLVAESFARHAAPSSDHGRYIGDLVDATLHIASLDDVPLEQLLEFRKREANDGSGTLRRMRHNFTTAIDTAARAMVEAETDTDRAAIQSDFERRMSSDLKEISSGLYRIGWSLVFSKPVVMAVLTGVSSVAPAMAGIADAATAFYDEQRHFTDDLTTVYRAHPMSWLHRQK